MAINWQIVHDIIVLSGTAISFYFISNQYNKLSVFSASFISFYSGNNMTKYTTNYAIDRVFLDPYLFGWEAEIFYKYIDQSKVYFEFGSGGTTHQAIKRKLKVYVAESHQCWINRLSKEVEEIKEKLKILSDQKDTENFKRWLATFSIDITYIVSDIESGINTSYSDALKYVRLYNHTKYKADFISVVGKYKFAVIMNLFNQVDTNTIIFTHELEDPENIKTISKFYDVLERNTNIYILRKKSQPPQLTDELLNTYESQDINYQGQNRQTLNFLRQNFNDVIEKYRFVDDSFSVKPPVNQIWFMWWQGEQEMPSLIRVCYASIKKNFKQGIVTMITEKNYKDYVTIPEHIIELFKSKKINIVNFSDVLRVFLICTRGGLWVDATMMVLKEIETDIFDYSFYTVRAYIKFFISYGKWNMYLQASKINSTATRFVSEMFNEYFKKYDHNFNYWMIDYFYFLGYEYVPIIRRLIQAVPVNNWFVHGLEKRINDVYEIGYYNHIVRNNIFVKLTYKRPVYPYDSQNRLTIFGHLQNKYLFDKE